MKNIIKFILFLIPYLLIGIFIRVDKVYYNSLNKPIFTLPSAYFSIIWIIIFILICITAVMISNKIRLLNSNDYLYTLISSYVTVFTYMLLFFVLKSPLLGFIGSVSSLLCSIFLFKETKKILDKYYLLLIPYILQNIYGVILSIFILFMNM